MTTRVSWIHAFVDLPEPLLTAGLKFWAAATSWPPRQPWPDHPEFHSLRSPDGDAYLHVQRIVSRLTTNGARQLDLGAVTR